MRKTLVVVCWLAGAGLGSSQAEPTRADIRMEDQFGVLHDIAVHRGDVVVLIYGDRRSAEANKALGEQLHVAFHPGARGQSPADAQKCPVRPVIGVVPKGRAPDVKTVAIASVGKVPDIVRNLVRGQIRKASPDVPVWLDFSDRMKPFGLAPGVPNIVVIDAAGVARYTASGSLSPEQFGRLTDLIEGLRREGDSR